VTKHSRAERARVRVAVGQGTAEVTVEDDGAGFDPLARTGGYSLVGMRERVELAHGRLFISSAPGKGTAVRASIPVPKAGETRT
jgi:signal transduction histidine kinase